MTSCASEVPSAAAVRLVICADMSGCTGSVSVMDTHTVSWMTRAYSAAAFHGCSKLTPLW